MPHPLMSWLVITVLFHCRASSPAQYALANPLVPPPRHLVTSPGLSDVSRDKTSLVITQCIGLPPLYSHPTIPLSVYYALNLFYRAEKPAPFTLCSERTRRSVLIAFSRALILHLLCSSGDVEVNPGPAAPSTTPIPRCPHLLTSVTIGALVLMHVNIQSLLPQFYSLLSHTLPTRMS